MTTTAHPTGHGSRPVLITDAGMSRQEEYKLRRRRYDLLMAGRVVCIIGAFVVGSVFSNIWLAGLLIAGAAVLPWAAVLIANDRLPVAAAARRAAVSTPPAPAVAQLETLDPADTTTHEIIDA